MLGLKGEDGLVKGVVGADPFPVGPPDEVGEEG